MMQLRVDCFLRVAIDVYLINYIEKRKRWRFNL